jgi:hypothetical protein
MTYLQAVAQTPTQNLPVVSIPATPEAAALSVRGIYSTGKFSGSMEYDLPIYTLKLPGLEIPIGLHYQSNGVKVDEIASRVGLDWSLEAGGVISRTIMNYPDEQPHYVAPPNIPINSNSSGSVWMAYVNRTLTNKENDIPDVFSFSFLHYSGKFYLTPNLQSVIMVPYQNLNISVNLGASGNQIVSFTIKTTDGNTFLFATTGSNNYSIQGNVPGAGDPRTTNSGTTSWFLSKITTPYKDTVNFQYNTNCQYTYNQGISQSAFGQYSNWNGQIGGEYYPQVVQPFTTSYQYYSVAEPLLKKILTTRSDSIVFTDDPNPRQDIPPMSNAPHKLQSIDIYNGNDAAPIKHVDFKLAYTTSTDNNLGSYGTFTGCLNRLFLDSVILDKTQTYSFNYDRRNLMPRVMSYARDPWGYFDGNTSKTSLISVPSSLASDLLQSGLQNIAQVPNPSVSSVGMLNVITYPTGGSRHIEYQQNGDSVTVIGGCRVSRTYETDVNNNIYNIIRYFYNSYAQRNTPLYTCNSTPVFVQSFLDTYVAPVATDANGTNGGATWPVGYLSKIGATRNKYSSGMLSSSQCDGNPCFYPIVTESYGNNFQNGGKESHFTGGCDQEPTLVSLNGLSLPPSIWVSILSATHPERNELNDEQFFKVSNSTKQVLKELKYTYGSDETKTQTIYGYILNRLYSSLYCYTYCPNQVPSVTYQSLFQTYCSDPLCAVYYIETTGNLASTLSSIVGTYENYVQLYQYSVLSKCRQLQQVVETDSLNGGVLTKTTYYSYNPYNMLSSKQETLENGTRILLETYTYSNQYSYSTTDSTLNALMQINQNNMIVPVEVTDWCNNQVVGSRLSKFNAIRGNYFLPSEKLSLKIQAPITNFSPSGSVNGTFTFDSRYTTDLYIDAYDAYGNILQYHRPGDIDNSYIWSYHNRLPVLKGENMTNSTLNSKTNTLLSSGNTNLTSLLSSLSTSGISNWTTFNNNLRNSLPGNTLVTSYTYKPQVGMTSTTAPQKVTTNYTYDTSNRLYLVRNDDENLLACYRYGYQNAPDNGMGGYTALSASGIKTNYSVYVVNTSGTATVNCTGGSGSFTYTWTLWSAGSSVTTTQVTTVPSISFTCSQIGEQLIQCMITDNQLGNTATATIAVPVASSAYSMQTGFANSYSSCGISSGTVSLYLNFYPTASAMQPGTSYLVASLMPQYCPSATRYLTYTVNGRTWSITIYTNGNMYFTIQSGTSLPVNSGNAFPLSYTQ